MRQFKIIADLDYSLQIAIASNPDLGVMDNLRRLVRLAQSEGLPIISSNLSENSLEAPHFPKAPEIVHLSSRLLFS